MSQSFHVGFCNKWQHKWLWFSLIGHLIKYPNIKNTKELQPTLRLVGNVTDSS